MQQYFSKEDKQKVVEFLNFIAEKAEFNSWKTEDSIKHFKLLAHMQTVILPKMDSLTLAVEKVVEDEENKDTVEVKE
jgi:hypothetical protein